MRKITLNLIRPVIRCKSRIFCPVMLALAFWVLQLAAAGQTVTWTDADMNEAWSDPLNWDTMMVPGRDCTTCDAVIPDVGTGRSPMDDVSSLTLDNVTVFPNAVVIMPSSNNITVNGNTLSGFFEMNPANGDFARLIINGNVTYADALQGLGIQMFDGSSIQGNGTLNNLGTIKYGLSIAGGLTGILGSSRLTLNNSGLICSSGTNSNLILEPNAAWTNSGTLEALSGGKATFFAGTVTQQGAGEIVANGGTVFLGSTTIIGGTLASSSGGTIVPLTGVGPTLSSLTMSAQYLIGTSQSAASTTLTGTIVNNGLIDLAGGAPTTTALFINSPVILTGTGSGVAMGGSNTTISGSGTLTSQQTIAGAGEINVGTLINQGTITAAASNGDNTLLLTPGNGGITNMGTIDAALVGSTIEISGGKVTNTGGTIASGQGIALLDNGVTVVGGTVAGNNSSYVEGKSATLDGTSGPVNVTGLFNVLDGDTTFLKGTINGVGNITVAGVSSGATLHVKGTTIIEGGMSVALGNDSPHSLLVGDGSTLSKATFESSTLEGNGLVSGVKVTIDPTSTVECLLNGTPLEFDSTSSALIQGSLLNPTGCTVKFDSNLLNVNPSTGTLTGGTFNLSGPVQQPSNIQTLNGNVTLNNSIAELENLSGGNALSTMTSIASKGALTLGSTVVLQTTGALTNAGTVTLNPLGFLDVGSSGLTQTAGVFSNSGTLNLPVGGVFSATGGTIEGNNGTFNGGNVTVGNPTGGAAATLLLGTTTKLPGTLTFTKNLALNQTAKVTVPMIGSTQGTQYGTTNVTGTAAMGGTLTISRSPSFIPPLGTVFTIFTASGGLSGTFSTVNGLSINGNEHLDIAYTPNTLTLTAAPGPVKGSETNQPVLPGVEHGLSRAQKVANEAPEN